MKYLSQINGFWNRRLVSPLNSKQADLYFALLHCANLSGWKKQFNAPNSTLQSLCGLSKNELIKARDILLAKGYISYQKGSRAKAGIYTIVPLYETYTGANYGTNPETYAEPSLGAVLREEKQRPKQEAPIPAGEQKTLALVIAELAGLAVEDEAKAAQLAVVELLQTLGFSCQTEYPIADYGDGKSGRLDVLAERRGLRLAIEIDHRSPRQRSIRKLQSLTGVVKLALVRGGEPAQAYPGIRVVALQLKDAASKQPSP